MAASAGLLVRAAVAPGAPLTSLALLGCGGAFVKLLAGIVAVHAEGKLASDAVESLRRDVTVGLLCRGAGSDGKGAPVVIGALRSLEGALRSGYFGRARGVLQLLPPVVACVWLSPVVALAALAAFATLAIPMSRWRHTLRQRERALAASVAELEHRMAEVIDHVDLFRVHGSGESASRLAGHAARAASAGRRSTERARQLLSGGNEVIAAVAITVVVALAERGFVHGVSELALLVPLTLLAYRPVKELTEARSAAESGAAAMAALGPWLGASSSPASLPAWGLHDLALRAFGGVDLVIKAGSILALTGPSGAGKTSLLRRLLGLAPSTGNLRYGDDDLTHAGVGPGARPFAWVPQDTPVFAGSVHDNLGHVGEVELAALALPTLASLRSADAIGRGGRALSGGERAIVSLARALATGLPVLLLDEPTANLDAAAERRVLEALQQLRGTRTILLVTHRAAAAEIADVVVEV